MRGALSIYQLGLTVSTYQLEHQSFAHCFIGTCTVAYIQSNSKVYTISFVQDSDSIPCLIIIRLSLLRGRWVCFYVFRTWSDSGISIQGDWSMQLTICTWILEEGRLFRVRKLVEFVHHRCRIKFMKCEDSCCKVPRGRRRFVPHCAAPFCVFSRRGRRSIVRCVRPYVK
jgi:hypothetical protein